MGLRIPNTVSARRSVMAAAASIPTVLLTAAAVVMMMAERNIPVAAPTLTVDSPVEAT